MPSYPPEVVKWENLVGDKEATWDKFGKIAAKTLEGLYKLSAAELASALPMIQIKEVGPDGVARVLLSNQLTSPPIFGRNVRFGERPDASIESVTIKTQNPRGWILYREIDLVIIVHRPDAVFDKQNNGIMKSLLDGMNTHLLTYGWVGGDSALTSGVTVHDPTFATNDGDKADDKALVDVFSAQKEIKFKVVNYDFNITADNQVHFNIRAIEDGELATRDAVIFNNRYVDAVLKESTGLTADEALKKVIDQFAVTLDALPKTIVNIREPYKPNVPDSKTSDEKVPFVALKDVFRVLFSDPLSWAASAQGYMTQRFQFGVFNERCPPVNHKFGGGTRKESGMDDYDIAAKQWAPAFDWKEKPIGDFQLRLDDVKKVLSSALYTKSQITVHGLMQTYFSMISNNPWMASRGSMQPEIILRSMYGKDTVVHQILDRLRYTDTAHRNPPKLSFGRALSFFKDLKFEVVNDEQMKSIFMQRQITRTRFGIANAVDPSIQETSDGLPQFAMMYRSAIKGSITMLGNFALDVFGTVNLDFGIPIWNQDFYVLNKVDTVTKEGFFSTVVLQASAANPLGNDEQAKRGDFKQANGWETGGGMRTAGDWIKYRLSEIANPASVNPNSSLGISYFDPATGSALKQTPPGALPGPGQNNLTPSQQEALTNAENLDPNGWGPTGAGQGRVYYKDAPSPDVQAQMDAARKAAGVR